MVPGKKSINIDTTLQHRKSSKYIIFCPNIYSHDIFSNISSSVQIYIVCNTCMQVSLHSMIHATQSNVLTSMLMLLQMVRITSKLSFLFVSHVGFLKVSDVGFKTVTLQVNSM